MDAEDEERPPVRVSLSGDRDGPYVVTAEYADGSLVLKPDRSPVGRVSVESTARLMWRLRRRPGQVPAASEALNAWGVELLRDERPVEFVMADVDGQRGFVALTDRRFIFLVRGRTSLKPERQRSRSGVTSVEQLRGRRKHGLLVSWEDSEPMFVESRDRDGLERLGARLLAR